MTARPAAAYRPRERAAVYLVTAAGRRREQSEPQESARVPSQPLHHSPQKARIASFCPLIQLLSALRKGAI